MFSDAWLAELLSKNDIVSIIGEYTSLTPKGGKLWACCPFHKEKTPSFTVDERKQAFYCFGCHVGGGVIQFVMLMQNSSFMEAVTYLAERSGTEIPKNTDDAEIQRRRALRERLVSACTEAARFYHARLIENKEAIDYLQNRKLTPAIIRRFGLGYSPDSRHALCEHLTKLGYTAEELIDAGLARKYDDKLFDFFHGRIMFPIISKYGKVIAFGGRVMGKTPDGVGKYVNTSDTIIYNKRTELYGLSMCKKGALSDLVIVEGYMDVISLHSAGVDNAVASLGTALTEEQAVLMKRHTQKVYLCYDGDSAGIRATLRGIDILSAAGLAVRVISIPGGDDPDDYVKKFGMDGFLSLKDKSYTANGFKIEQLSTQYDLHSPDGRQEYAIAACKLIKAMQPVEQPRYCRIVADKTGFSVDTLTAQLDTAKPTAQEPVPNNSGIFRHNRERMPKIAQGERDKYEYMLVACAAADKTACEIVRNVSDELIVQPELAEFLKLASAAYANGEEEINIARLLSKIPGDTSRILSALCESIPTAPIENAKECISSLRKKILQDELVSLSSRLDAGTITMSEYKERYTVIKDNLAALAVQNKNE